MTLNHYTITTPAGAVVALRVAQSSDKALSYPSANPHCTATVWRKSDDPEPLRVCPRCGSPDTVIWSRKDPSRVCNHCKKVYSLATRRDKYWPDEGLTTHQQIYALYRQGATIPQIAEAMGSTRQGVTVALATYNKRLQKSPEELQSITEKISQIIAEDSQKLSQAITSVVDDNLDTVLK